MAYIPANANGQATMANSAPVTLASDQIITPRGYDPQDDMIKVKSMQKKFRDSFSGGIVDPAKWVSSVGTGGSISAPSGALILASGTTADSTTHVTSVETFTIPVRLSVNLTLSQRIANQTLYVELISVDPATLVPDGQHGCGFAFDGVTVTQGKYYVQCGGNAPLVSAASTMPTTAGTGLYEVEPFSDETWFHGGLQDSTAGRANSYRRHQQIPDPNAIYKIRLRWLNGASPPATTTTATLNYVSCQDYAELTAEITAGRGQTVAGQAIGVAVVSTPTTVLAADDVHDGASGTTVVMVGGYAYGLAAADNALPAVSANADAVRILANKNGAQVVVHLPEATQAYAPTNVTTTAYAASLISKASAGTLYMITGYNNHTSDQFVQVHDAATLPADTAVPKVVFKVPAGGNFSYDLGSYGRYFATGIVICNSSTGPTKTLGAANCWFDVQVK